MNKEEYEACGIILQKILSRPESEMFKDSSDDTLNINIKRPITLYYFIQRYNEKKFSTTHQFISTLKDFFFNITTADGVSPIRKVMAADLLNEIDKAVKINAPTLPSTIIPIHSAIFNFYQNNIPPKRPIIGETQNNNQTFNKQPGSMLFSSTIDPSNIRLLIRDIKLLNMPSLTLRLAAYVTRLQPDAVILSESFSLNIALLSPENKINVRQYVTKLLNDAASGKINPFERPFGQKLNFIKIQERGSYTTPQKTSNINSFSSHEHIVQENSFDDQDELSNVINESGMNQTSHHSSSIIKLFVGNH